MDDSWLEDFDNLSLNMYEEDEEDFDNTYEDEEETFRSLLTYPQLDCFLEGFFESYYISNCFYCIINI